MLKLMTWNVGMFSWYKYYCYFGIKLNGHPVKNEYFQNLDFVADYIKQVNPDICFLQEFFTTEDSTLMSDTMKSIYPYATTVSTWYHKHSILILSKDPIVTEEFAHGEFVIVKSFEKTFIPIHLNSFYAEKRLSQVKDLLGIANNVEYVIGDTNFWSYGNHFLFSKDKQAYKLLLQEYFDTGKQTKSTSLFRLNFDRIFFRKDARVISIESTRIRQKGFDHFPVIIEVEK